MTVMNDFFKRGYQFDGATGEKTGANLEDLATRLVPTAGSQLVDDSSLQVFANAAGIVDDAGVAINQLRVKAGGITASHLAKYAAYGTKMTLVSGDIIVSSVETGITDWSNMLDGDPDTMTAEGRVTPSGTSAGRAVYIYVDLGDVYDGFIRVIGDIKLHTAAAGYDAGLSTFWKYAATAPGTGGECGTGIADNTTATYYTYGAMHRFFGRYAGIAVSADWTYTYFKMREFEIYRQL